MKPHIRKSKATPGMWVCSIPGKFDMAAYVAHTPMLAFSGWWMHFHAWNH